MSSSNVASYGVQPTKGAVPSMQEVLDEVGKAIETGIKNVIDAIGMLEKAKGEDCTIEDLIGQTIVSIDVRKPVDALCIDYYSQIRFFTDSGQRYDMSCECDSSTGMLVARKEDLRGIRDKPIIFAREFLSMQGLPAGAYLIVTSDGAVKIWGIADSSSARTKMSNAAIKLLVVSLLREGGG